MKEEVLPHLVREKYVSLISFQRDIQRHHQKEANDGAPRRQLPVPTENTRNAH